MSTIQTSLCSLLGIEAPIVQAPMGNHTGPAIAAAVSNAGGLGMLGMTFCGNSVAARDAVRATLAATSSPFGVNFILRFPHDDYIKICIDEGVKIFSFFWGDPTPYIEYLHRAGALVMHTVGSAREASEAVRAGVDVVVAQGWEAGGHVWGQVATLPLIPVVVDVAGSVPVVAAGGIADGRGLAAALALGAAGVWLGTRFIASDEFEAHPLFQERVLGATETDSCYGVMFDGAWPDSPHRAIINSTIRNWLAAGRPRGSDRPGSGERVATTPEGRPIHRYDVHTPRPGTTGDIESLAMYAGQSAGLVTKKVPAAAIVRNIVNEAALILERSPSYIRSDSTPWLPSTADEVSP